MVLFSARSLAHSTWVMVFQPFENFTIELHKCENRAWKCRDRIDGTWSQSVDGKCSVVDRSEEKSEKMVWAGLVPCLIWILRRCTIIKFDASGEAFTFTYVIPISTNNSSAQFICYGTARRGNREQYPFSPGIQLQNCNIEINMEQTLHILITREREIRRFETRPKFNVPLLLECSLQIVDYVRTNCENADLHAKQSICTKCINSTHSYRRHSKYTTRHSSTFNWIVPLWFTIKI